MTELRPNGFVHEQFNEALIPHDGPRLPRWARASLGAVLRRDDDVLVFSPSGHPALKGFPARELGHVGDAETATEIEKAFRDAAQAKRDWKVQKARKVIEQAELANLREAERKTSKPAAKAASDYPAATEFNDGL
jgi:hypothetical protein